MEKINVLQKD